MSALRDLADLRARLAALGAGPAHIRRVLRLWVQGLPQDHGRQRIEDFLPLRLRQALPALTTELAGLATVESRHPAQDGGERLLLRLQDGQRIEAVLLPRGGLCVSTQVGCAVGCRFCMTGQGGLLRQVGSAEILAQVATARGLRAVKKVVFMGMGEPAHNLDAVLESIQFLGTDGAIGHKDLVFSTVGDPRVFERLSQAAVKPALALSLHSMDAARRAELLPRAPRYEPAALLELATAYAESTGYPLQVQWTLLAGLNDGDEEVEALGRQLAGRYAIVNFIPYNTVEGLPFRRPDPVRTAAMALRLTQLGVLTRFRHSAAQDVEGGCGQLRARTQQR